MEEIFQSLSECVSEACFDEILNMVEELLLEKGIMGYIKGGMDPQKAKEAWAKDKNNEYVEAEGNFKNATKLRRQAYKKFKKGLVPYATVADANKREDEARKISKAKFNTQLGANYDVKSTKGKMVLPQFSNTPDGSPYISGFTKGGKKFTPKQS